MEDNFATACENDRQNKVFKQFCKNNKDSLQILIIQDIIFN